MSLCNNKTLSNAPLFRWTDVSCYLYLGFVLVKQFWLTDCVSGVLVCCDRGAMYSTVQHQYMLYDRGDYPLQTTVSPGAGKECHRGRGSAKYILDRSVYAPELDSIKMYIPDDYPQHTLWSDSRAQVTVGL